MYSVLVYKATHTHTHTPTLFELTTYVDVLTMLVTQFSRVLSTNSGVGQNVVY